MHARKLILAVVVGGPFLGIAMGLAANPDIVPPPEPAWRQAKPDPIFTESNAAAPSLPDFATTYAIGDRTPTWKRRAIAVNEMRYVAPPSDPLVDRFARDEAPPPAEPEVRPAAIALDAAAEAHDPARAAQAPASDTPQPAAVEPEPAIIG